MPKYKTIDGRIFNVKVEDVNSFTSRFPNATLIEDVISDPQMKQLKTTAVQQPEPSAVSTLASSFGVGFVEFAKGFENLKEGMQLGAFELINEIATLGEFEISGLEKKAALAAIRATNVLGNSESYDPIINKLEENIPEYETKSITEDLEKGNYAQAGFRAVNAALRSAPSLVAAATGVGGLIALGGSAAGNKFEEEFEADPEKSTGILLANAGVTGTTEAAFELVTRGLLKRAGFLKDQGNIKAAKELLQGGVKNIVKNIGFGLTAEGASEAATELTVAFEDYIMLGKEIPKKDLMYRLGDSFIVGSLIGGTISSVGEVGKTMPNAKDRAEAMLMPENIKQQISKKAEELNEFIDDLPSVSPEGKGIVVDKINEIEDEIINLKKESSSLINNLKGEDLVNYSKNIEEINSVKNVLKNAKTDSEKNIADQKYKTLQEENISILKDAKVKAADVVTETIKKTIKEGDLPGQVTEMTSDEISNIKEEGFDSKTAAKQFGFIKQFTDGSFEIILNKDKPMVGTAAHEFMHAVLFKTLGNNQQLQDSLGDALVDHVAELGGETSVLGKRLQNYGRYENDIFVRDANFGEETITIMSEEIINGNLKFQENLFTKIGDIIRRFSQDYLGKEIVFDTGRDVYNFVKDYSKSIKEGKINKAVLKVAREGARGKLVDTVVDPQAGVQMSREAVTPRAQQFLNAEIDNESLADIINAKTSSQEDKFAAVEALIEKNWPVISKALKFNPTGNIPMRAVKEAVNEQMLGIFPQVTLPDGKKISRNKPLLSTYNKENEVTTFLDATLRNRQAEIFTRAKAIGGTEQVGVDISEAKDVKAPKPVKIKPTVVKEKILLETFGESDLQDEIREDVKIAGVTDVEKYLDFKKELVKHRKFMKDGTEITPELKAKYKEQDKKPPKELKSKRIPTGKYYFILEKVAAYYGITDPIRLITEKDLDTKQRKAAQDKILSKRDEHIVSLPEGTTKAGDPTGIANTALGKAFFKAGGRTKFAETGTGKGLKEQAKQRIEPQAYLNIFGLIPKARVNNTSVDPAIRSQIIQTAVTAVRQAAQQERKALNLTKEAVNKYRDGKSNIMYSKSYGNEVLKKIKLDEVSNKNTNDRSVFKFFIENEMPKYIPIPRLKSGVFRLPSDTYGNRSKIVPGFYITKDERKISAKKAGNTQLKNKKVFTQEQTDQITKSYSQVNFTDNQKNITNRKEGANIFIKGLNKTINGKDGNLQNLRPAAMIIGGSANATYHIVRMMAPGLGVSSVGKLKIKEHVLTASDFGNILFNSLVKNNIDLVSPWLLDNYYQININEQQGALIDNAYKNSSEEMPLVFYENLNKAIEARNMSLASDPLIRYTMANVNLSEIDWHDGGTALTYIDKKYNFDGSLSYGNNSETTIKMVNDILTEFFAKKITKNQAKEAVESVIKIKFSKTINSSKTLNKAVQFSRSSNNPIKGITVLDFDDTLATTKSLVRFTAPDGTTGTLNAEEYASTYQDLLEQGYKFDFTEFDKVVKAKIAPLFQKALKLQKKFGPENMFILTARPPAAQKAIRDFLKANGLNIPLKNITGLGNSTSEAKALWIAEKVGEGYNDFYFADDALQNVQAVKNMLSQFDVKSKVQQAKVKFSKDVDTQFNDILQDVSGIESKKRYSAAKARKRGEGKGRFRIFIPPSHEDFVGLLYNFMGKGEKGNKHRAFFEEALVKPLNTAYRELNSAKQSMANDYKSLIKQLPDVRKKLTKKTPDGDYLYSDAIRVYLWDKFGFEIPGMTKTDIKTLVNLVESDVKLQSFAESVGLISKEEQGYVQPNKEWEIGDIRTDLAMATQKIGRQKYFSEFIENADIIFSETNLNKIEAAFGKNFREALEDVLFRTINGTNRRTGNNRLVNRFTDYINGSVGATMFFNARSAVLQTLSMVNFINYADNNIFKAALAFSNQKQYWQDFAMIFNSDMLKQRRTGIAFDVNANELASVVSKSKQPVRAAMKHLLQIGFLPTQMADSFAIASGGSTFYRNRVNTYIKQNLSKQEAENKAFDDFQELAEMTQQSARPDMISQQQASPLGKLILAFQNTPSQYNRIIKKATLDLVNRRKRPPYKTQLQSDMSNVSRILYYGGMQNLIFYSLQSALFAMLFSDDEEDEEFFGKKQERIISGSIDTILRGMGVGGAVISTVKNTIIKVLEKEGKSWGSSKNIVVSELLQLSPPIGIKARKLESAERTYNWNKDVISEMETFNIHNPVWSVVSNTVEATTNFPMNRVHTKLLNIEGSLDNNYEYWQRIFMFAGWNKWNLGAEDYEIKEVKEQIKERTKQDKKERKKQDSKTKIKKFKKKKFKKKIL